LSGRPRKYVTTPIYYPSGEPHIGHAYTTILADALARFARQDGTDVLFLTGTDEHGQKMQDTADARGMSPRELSDEMSALFAAAWKTLPSWALVAVGDKAIGTSGLRAMAQRAGAQTVEVPGSHVVMISQPDATTDLVQTAARSLPVATSSSR